MGKWFGLAVSIVILSIAGRAGADLSASATISSQQLGPSSWQYSLTLQNTGSTPIGTYWFGWVPFYDLLPSMPTAVNSPNGWTGTPAADYFGVGSAQWVNTTNPLQPGQTMTGFQFTSPDSPSAINGTSFYANFPVEQSYVYIGGPETDSGFAFRTATVPEPASFGLVGGLAAILRRRRPRAARA